MDAAAPRFSPDFTRFLATAWTWGIALCFLFLTGLYHVPLLLIQVMPAVEIGPHAGAFLLGRVADIGCVAGILATAFGVGAIIVAPRDRLEALYALALGLWVVAGATLCLGAWDVTKVPWVFAGLLCWLSPRCRQSLRVESRAEKVDTWSKAMLACVIVAAFLNLPGTLAPPFEYDELEYHLGALADYRRMGHIAFLPHNFYSNLPQLTEMLYLLATQTSSDMAAKLVHWMFGVLTAVSVYALGAKLWTRRVGLTAAAVFYCAPFVQDVSQTGRIDLATTFFGTLAFGAVLLEWPGWAAMAAGCAVATKWPAVAVVLLPAMAMIGSLRRSVVFGLLSAVFVLPWLVKNWLLTGNPVYPLLYDVFRSPHWSAAQAAVFAGKHYPSFDFAGLTDFLRLAWRYSVTEPRAVPVLLMLAPLVLLFRNVKATARRAAWLFLVAYLGWWLLTFRPWRFLLPAFPMAALVGADVLRDRLARAAVTMVLALALLMMTLNILVDVEAPDRVPARVSFLQHALGQTSREEFWSRAGDQTFEPIQWMNRNLPATARVLYVGEARVYYARHAVLWSTAFDRHPLDELAKPPTDAERLLAALRARGVTHVYVNFSEWERLRSHYEYLLHIDSDAFRNLLQRHARQIHATGRKVVWELE
jgi:hypothetical protein